MEVIAALVLAGSVCFAVYQCKQNKQKDTQIAALERSVAQLKCQQPPAPAAEKDINWYDVANKSISLLCACFRTGNEYEQWKQNRHRTAILRSSLEK